MIHVKHAQIGKLCEMQNDLQMGIVDHKIKETYVNDLDHN